MISLIRTAGVVHLVILAANIVLPRILKFEEGLGGAPLIIRQIFRVHHAYIMLVLGFFGFLCLAFPAELAGDSPLGSALAAFMAFFWLARLPIQLFYYDRELCRARPVEHYAFTFAVCALAVTLTAAALGVLP